MRFNPRSPCGERHKHYHSPQGHLFSTHAPLAGSDYRWSHGARPLVLFLPTLPHELVHFVRPVSTHALLAGSDGLLALGVGEAAPVSTHAPLAGSDWATNTQQFKPACFNPRSPCGEGCRRRCATGCSSSFNPRSPCGERRSCTSGMIWDGQFQPTLPLRGATSPSLAIAGNL